MKFYGLQKPRFILDMFKNVEQEEQIEALTLGLQKVSAKIEISRHAPQLVTNR